MPSVLDQAKRALVRLILLLAQAYGSRVTVTRESSDSAVKRSYRALSLKVHRRDGCRAAGREGWRAGGQQGEGVWGGAGGERRWSGGWGSFLFARPLG